MRISQKKGRESSLPILQAKNKGRTPALFTEYFHFSKIETVKSRQNKARNAHFFGLRPPIFGTEPGSPLFFGTETPYLWLIAPYLWLETPFLWSYAPYLWPFVP